MKKDALIQENRHASGIASKILSLVVLLFWLGVLAFLAKWFFYWDAGRLVPGQGTSMRSLEHLFIFAFGFSVGGIYLSARTLMGKLHWKWQVVNFIAAFLVFWAAAGD